MPVVSIEGRELGEINKKRQLVKEITDIVAKIYELPKEDIIVLIKGYPKENIGVAGSLVIDKVRK